MARRPRWRRLEPVSGFQDAVEAAGAAVARRMDRSRASRGGDCCRRRASIHGQGSSGRGLDRWSFSVSFSLPVAASVFCGPFQSHCAMEFPLALGLAAAAGVDVVRRRRRGFLEASVRKGSRDLVVIYIFLGALSERWVGQLSPYSCMAYLFSYASLYCFLNS